MATPISYYWEFGDGDSSTEESPSHTYKNPGAYTVSLTIFYDDNTEITETKEYYIRVGFSPLIGYRTTRAFTFGLVLEDDDNE